MHIKRLGLVSYLDSQVAMQQYIESVDSYSDDQIWLLEHLRVYTQGVACEMQTLLPSDIPIVKSDRGGQITYHGPGQIIMYVMINLKRHKLGIKSLVNMLEQSVIDLLEQYQIQAERKEGAPGVYVEGAKIAALGLRVKKGFSYHGLSLNVDMDLSPFENIDPCGYEGLQVTQLSDLVDQVSVSIVQQELLDSFKRRLVKTAKVSAAD